MSDETQTRPSLASRALFPALLRATRAKRVYASRAAAEANVEEQMLRPPAYGPPRLGMPRDVTVTVERREGWPVYTITPTGGPVQGAVVYPHGGAWVHQIVPSQWRFAANLAAATGTAVIVPIYPLVPLGTAAEVVAGTVALVRRAQQDHGVTCLVGDSAGGQIALSAAQILRDEGVVLPRAVLISPAVDLSLANPELDAVADDDPWLAKPGSRVYIEHWQGDLPIDDPRVSPITGDLRGLGPLTVFSSTRDMLYPDVRRLVRAAQDAGVTVDYHEEPGLVHDFPLTPTPEGRRARRQIVDALRPRP